MSQLKEEKARIAEEESKQKQQQKEEKKTVSLLRNPSLVVASSLGAVHANAVCLPPPAGSAPVYVPPRDDAAEFDDAGPDLKGIEDDKAVVAWRKSNKEGPESIA